MMMKPKKYIGQMTTKNLQAVLDYALSLKPNEDLIIYVRDGVIRTQLHKDGEEYSVMADNDFSHSLKFTSCKAILKLEHEN